MMIKWCLAVSIVAGTAVCAPMAVAAQEVPAEYQQVLSTVGKQGDFKDGVLKVNIPRTDVKVTVAGVATPTPFGFGGWVAMTKGEGGHEVLMGDLVLLQDEVNPVMSTLLDNGFDVTALHNHFFWDEPRMYYMHVHGHGTAAELAQKLKPVFALIGKSTGDSASAAPAPAAAPAQNALNTAKLVEIVGTQGEQNGAVYKFTLGRSDLKVVEMGATINARMRDRGPAQSHRHGHRDSHRVDGWNRNCRNLDSHSVQASTGHAQLGRPALGTACTLASAFGRL